MHATRRGLFFISPHKSETDCTIFVCLFATQRPIVLLTSLRYTDPMNTYFAHAQEERTL